MYSPENFEKPQKTPGYNPKGYREWNGKKCKAKYSSDMKLYSWFLGPKAENADIFERLILEAIRDCVFWRRNFHPEDEILITEEVRRDTSFQESNDLLQQEFLKLLAELKRGIPFYSPRYIGHMLGDQLLPAVVGYFAAMLHNPNNVTPEASPITTEIEMKVAEQLAKMVGYKDNTWGHITSGGTIANFEAIWVARNLKYFPIGAKKVAEELKLEIEIDSPIRSIEKLSSADNWTHLNLDTDKVLEIRAKLIDAYRKENQSLSNKEVEEKIDNELAIHTISGKGTHQFFADLDPNNVKPGVILMPATAHYSLIKVTEALGIGKQQIVYIPVDEHFRMDIATLEKTLQTCLDDHKPIIALISVLGSTEEGAVDYIHEIIELQSRFREKGLNFYHHCDAAWGGYIRTLFYDENGDEILFYDENGDEINNAGAIMKITRTWPPDEILKSFSSICKADSVTMDPHKLGYIPYPAGAIVFKNERVRELISFDAPYIFREKEKEGKPYIGHYILEGSKPGAAAVACWLAQKIVPLDQSGYGEIIGKSLQSAQEFNLKFRDLCLELQKNEIELRVLTDPPDTNIFCFIVNRKVNGKKNSSLKEMNELNNAIYNKLKFNPEEAIQTHEFIISITDFEYEKYGILMTKGENSMQKHLAKIGIDKDEFEKIGKITILRCTFMSPWPALSRGGRPDYVAKFASVLKKTIEGVVEEQSKEKN